VIPFLPLTIKNDVTANRIKDAENISENQVHQRFGL